MEKLLPRHYQLICEVNRRFLEGDVERKWPGDDERSRARQPIRRGHCLCLPEPRHEQGDRDREG